MARGMIVRAFTRHKKQYKDGGQSIIEYTMFIAVVVLALLAMQVYLKRGLQGKIKDMADQVSTVLYNPNTTESNFTTRASSHTEAFYSIGRTAVDKGAYTLDVISDYSNRTGRQEVTFEIVEVLF